MVGPPDQGLLHTGGAHDTGPGPGIRHTFSPLGMILPAVWQIRAPTGGERLRPVCMRPVSHRHQPVQPARWPAGTYLACW